MRNKVPTAVIVLCAPFGCTSGAQVSTAATPVQSPASATSVATFDWFSYEGQDPAFQRPVPEGHYRNPVLAGFYPDPSVVRVEDDYYLVNSSFAYFPGLPIFHSKDLTSWRQIGHGFSRRSQLQLESGQTMSRGLFAPTLRFHDGLFYIINTDVDGIGNFLITAKDPAGPWSDPVRLPEVGGIDPDLFFDDDGRVYIAHNDEPEGQALYSGHRAIWLWELDLANLRVIAGSHRVLVNGGADITKEPIWIEGPHLYKHDGWYYLMCAEGGTGTNHSEVVFRSRSLREPFVPYEKNPILTQRDLDAARPFPVSSTGHADLVSTPGGDWWAVFLGVRPYGGDHFNTGRETFLLPVRWESGWPRILDEQTPVPHHAARPSVSGAAAPAPPLTGNFTWRDDFDSPTLGLDWVMLRTSPARWYELNPSQSSVQLTPLPLSLSDKQQPAYLGRRQQHGSFTVETQLEPPQSDEYSAGLAVFQSSVGSYYFGVRKQPEAHLLFIERVTSKGVETVGSLSASLSGPVVLGATQRVDHIDFYFRSGNSESVVVAARQDATPLSTSVAGGFVGSTVGIHARREAGSPD